MINPECAKKIARGGWREDALLGRCTFPIGPRNTYSNVAYPVVGAVLYALLRTPSAMAFAVCMLALGLGSGYYHGAKTLESNKLDWAGMYVVFTALVLHGLAPDHDTLAVLVVPLSGITAYVFAYKLNGVGMNAHMGLFLGLAMLPPSLNGQAVLALSGFGLFLLAYGIWTLDKRGSKLSGVWGHAIWHVLTALAIGTVYYAQQRILP